MIHIFFIRFIISFKTLYVKLADKLGDLAITEISAGKKVRYEFKKEMCKYQISSGKKL